MTGPMPEGLDPRIQRNLSLMQGKLSDADVRNYLTNVEHVDPGQYLGGGATGDGGDSWMRGAGLAGRAVIQGLGGLANINPFTAPARLGDQSAGIPNVPLGDADATQMGLPAPNTLGERMAVAGGEMVTQGLATGMGPVGTAVQGLSGVAGQGAAEAGASPLGQMAAQMAVGMGFPVLRTLLSGGIKAALAGAGARKAASQQAYALMQAGAPNTATAGQVAQGGIARTLEGGLRNVPGAGQTLQGAYQGQAESMGQRVVALADRIAPGGSPTVAGSVIQSGIEQGYIPRFKAASSKLYDAVFQQVKPDLPVMPTETTKLIANQNQLSSQARELSDDIVNPKFASILNHIDEATTNSPDGTIPLNVLKELRSRLGAILSGDELVADINVRDVNRLYGSLSDDIRGALQQQSPEAVNAWDAASNFWKQGTDHIQKYLQPLMNKNTPEKAFTALMSGTKDGATALGATMSSLAPEERKLVSSTVLRRLGQANPSAQDDIGSVFSPETYLTRWNNLAPEAKSALFEGIDPNLPKDLNTLAKSMSVRKMGGKTMFNPSGTASNVVFGSIMAGLGVSATGAMQGNMGQMLAGLGPLAGAGAANLAAKMFTNPKMVKWMVSQTRVPAGAIAVQLLGLQRQAQKWDPESQGLATELNDLFKGADWQKILMSTGIAQHMTPSQ